MNNRVFTLRNVLALFCLLALTACGGGSGGGGGSNDTTEPQSGEFSGNTAEASITEENVQDLSIASAEGALHAAKGDDGSPTTLPFGISASLEDSILARATAIATDLPVGVSFNEDETTNCLLSGTERIISDFELSGNNDGAFEGTFTFIYDNCQDAQNYTEDGRINVEFELDGSYTVTFVDYTVTINGVTQSYSNTTVSCDSNYNCVYNDDFVGVTNNTYRVSNTSVSGNNSSGFNISGRIYHDTYGYVDFSAVNFTYCDNGYPGTGTITITAQGVTAQIEFTSCSSFTYTLNGVSLTYAW